MGGGASKASGDNKPAALVVCGPSGVGKGTIINKLMENNKDKYGFSVSHTTRDPRPGEEDKVHYNFVTKEDMEKEIAEGMFIEYNHVHGNIYGTSKKAVESVLSAGKCCILDIDVQGARAVKKAGIKAIFVFVDPPSYEELEKRLRGRGTETEEKIQLRLGNAKSEMDAASEPGLFHHRIKNEDLDEAVSKLKEIAERARKGHAAELEPAKVKKGC